MLTISIIMPALNEASALTQAVYNVLQSFDRLQIEGEIIIVNDGSTDKTGEIAENFCRVRTNVRVIHHSEPKGIGASFWEGSQTARYEVVTMLPGDGENDSLEILRYLPLMDHVDIVVPFVYNREIRNLKRRLVSKLYKGIINLTFGMLLNYMNGTVMYRRNVLLGLDLESRGFFYQTELLIKGILRGYLYAEVPYALSQRVQGKSKALTVSSLFKLSGDYLKAIRAVYFRKNNQRLSIVNSSKTVERRQSLEQANQTIPLGLTIDLVEG